MYQVNFTEFQEEFIKHVREKDLDQDEILLLQALQCAVRDTVRNQCPGQTPWLRDMVLQIDEEKITL